MSDDCLRAMSVSVRVYMSIHVCVIKCVIYSNSCNGDSYNNNSYYCNINNDENSTRDGVYLGPSLIEHFLK